MRFPIAMEPATHDSAWGVVVPDLPGCFSAGDTAEDAFSNAAEAIEAFCEILTEENLDIPQPRPLVEWQREPDYFGWVWALIDVDVQHCDGRAEKINITLPRQLLTKIDAHAKAQGATRSRFLADAARAAMRSN